jgi:transposase
VLTIDSHWRKVTVIGSLTLTPQGRLGEQFMLLSHAVTWWDAVEYLVRLRRRFRRPLWVIWDRLPAHRKAARLFAALELSWARFTWLPPAAPDLNPVEGLWSNTKYAELANVVPDNPDQHRLLVETSLERVRRQQKLLRSFFAAAHLSLPPPC